MASIPGAFQVNDCRGGATTAVAACSYVRASSSAQDFVWVAGPWFTDRFVQFDVSKPAAGQPGSFGTMWFTPNRIKPGQCKFST